MSKSACQQLLEVNGRWESQLTSLQGPLPLFVDYNGCCKHCGDMNAHEGGQTNAPLGPNTSYLNTPQTKAILRVQLVLLQFRYARVGFHVSSSRVRNYVVQPRLLIGPTEASV